MTSRRDVEAIERVWVKIAEEDRFFKTLLDFGNLHKAGLISEAKHARRKKEKEVEEMRNRGRVMTDATMRRLESWAPQPKKKDGSSKPRIKPPHQAKRASADEVSAIDHCREKRATKAETVREANLQVMRKRHIEGALDVTPFPKRPRGPNEDAAMRQREMPS
ncbi:unnamed protein product [Prunus armeniaca]|uniref:Uncharacterized protein n=1 Tax=Prunus armeniaca TaxID=36596 RepID=A0A6J5XNF6_PRUAR|nr:unnamed protein product [Prunus armeniaca]CAB4313933.1 unnamed protein product [Prunus armeniaca]